MTYSEKLKDPRWQRKRLEVLSAAGFKCEECGDGTATLHVHHCYYEKGLMPWEYPDEALKCVCEFCHKERQEAELSIQRMFCEMTTDELKEFQGWIMNATLSIGVEAMSREVAELVRPRWD